MTIPDRQELNEAFEKLVVEDYDQLSRFERFEICEMYFTEVESGTGISTPRKVMLGVGLSGKCTISLESLVTRVVRLLQETGHFGFAFSSEEAQRALANYVLAIARVAAFEPKQTKVCLEKIIETISDAVVEQYCVSHVKQDNDFAYSFGGFRYGKLDIDRVEENFSLSVKANAELARKKLTGYLALSREVDGVKTINQSDHFFQSRVANEGTSQSCVLRALISGYFELVTKLLWDDFFIQLDKRQAVNAAIGIPHISLRDLTPFPFTSDKLTFVKRLDEQYCWFSETRTEAALYFSPSQYTADLSKALVKGLQIQDWGTYPLDEKLQQFSEYFLTVLQYRLVGRTEEALLHCVFGLDLLLGGATKERLSVHFRERVASIVSSVLESEYGETQKFMKSIYGFRNEFVHEGGKFIGDKNDPHELLNRLVEISRIVFAAGCWARRLGWCVDAKNWLLRIDVLRAKLNAGMDATDEVSMLGLDRIRRHRTDGRDFVIEWPAVSSPPS